MFQPSTGDRVAVVYGALFFALGLYLPFYPLLLATRGLSDAEIALVIAIPLALRSVVAAPLGHLADRIGDRRRVLILYSCIAAAAFSAFPLVEGFGPLLFISTMATLFTNGAVPVTDALATSMVRLGQGDYGRMRMWGSVSFVIANVVGGIAISQTSAAIIFWGLFLSYWLSAIILSLATPRTGKPVQDDAGRASPPASLATLIRDRVLMAGLFAAGLIQASHAMMYSFGSLYWRETGFSGAMIGLFWAVGVLAEIAMFFISGRLFRTWGAGQMLVLSAGAAMARWGMFPVVTTSVGYLGLQLLHALSFACCHLAMMRLILTRVPDRSAATIQGLYTTVGALAMSGTTLLSGLLYRLYGGQGFQVMAGIALVGGVCAIVWIGLRQTVQAHKV